MLSKGTQYTKKFIVSPELHSGFMNLFEDRNPLHTDEAFAQEKGFKSKVMHGNILNGFLSYFVGECLPIKNVIIHSQDIKYSKPVFLNDSITLHAEIKEFFESVNVLQISFYFENDENSKLATGHIQLGILS